MDIRGYEKLKITCTMADCDNDQHCFRTNKRLQNKGIEKGHCRYCDIDLIDWERVYKRDIQDIQYLFSALKLEMVRNMFWSVKNPTLKMIEDVTSISEEQLREKIIKRLKSSISKPKSQNYFDGRQTPVDENLIHWAQHATGTCCRVCLDQWHGIGPEETITEENYYYLADVIMGYIKAKIQLRYT